MEFEWDSEKNIENIEKHGVSFEEATEAWNDPQRVIRLDEEHSRAREVRYHLLGRVGGRVMTVRYTLRDGKVRIFGAGYWRGGVEIYERKNSFRKK